MRPDLTLVNTSVRKYEVHYIKLRCSQFKNCDRPAAKMIVGIMRAYNEKDSNGDNTVSNERTEMQQKSSSREIIMLLAPFMTFVQDINTDEG